VESANLKEQIKKLKQLQIVDKEIYALREEKDKLPEELKLQQDIFEGKKEVLAQIEAKYTNLLKEKKDKELQLGSKEENIQKLQAQLYSLKTNKEYSAMLHEIEAAKADKSIFEDQILSLLEEMDKIEEQKKQEKDKLAKEEAVYLAAKKKIEDRIKEIEARINQLEAERKRAAEGIQPRIFAQYERILKNRQGLAIVNVVENACQGCFMNVTHQIVNEIKMYDKIVTCPACQRILYLEEDVG